MAPVFFRNFGRKWKDWLSKNDYDWAKEISPEPELNLHGYHHYHSSVFERPSHPVTLQAVVVYFTSLPFAFG